MVATFGFSRCGATSFPFLHCVPTRPARPADGRDFPCSSSPDTGIPRTPKGNWLSITHPGHQREYMDWRTLSPFTTTQGQFVSVPGQLASFLPVSWWVKSGLAPRGSGSFALSKFSRVSFQVIPGTAGGHRCRQIPFRWKMLSCTRNVPRYGLSLQVFSTCPPSGVPNLNDDFPRAVVQKRFIEC